MLGVGVGVGVTICAGTTELEHTSKIVPAKPPGPVIVIETYGVAFEIINLPLLFKTELGGGKIAAITFPVIVALQNCGEEIVGVPAFVTNVNDSTAWVDKFRAE